MRQVEGPVLCWTLYKISFTMILKEEGNSHLMWTVDQLLGKFLWVWLRYVFKKVLINTYQILIFVSYLFYWCSSIDNLPLSATKIKEQYFFTSHEVYLVNHYYQCWLCEFLIRVESAYKEEVDMELAHYVQEYVVCFIFKHQGNNLFLCYVMREFVVVIFIMSGIHFISFFSCYPSNRFYNI